MVSMSMEDAIDLQEDVHLRSDQRILVGETHAAKNLESYVRGTWDQYYNKVVADMLADKVRSLIEEAQRVALGLFCKEHNLCPICITGGWDCGSDHA